MGDESPRPDDGDPFREAILDALSSLEAGECSKTISTRDEALMAFLIALEACPEERASVGRALARAAGREPEPDPVAIDRSAIVRLAVRAGLDAAAADHLEILRSAVGEHARRTL